MSPSLIAAIQRHFRREVDVWSVSTVLVAILILIPLATVVGGLAQGGEKWDHIAETFLWKYVANTLILIGLVVLLSMVMAIPPAWLVSAFEFPGRKIFEWALVLPLAIPTYVAAFVYYEGKDGFTSTLVSIKRSWGLEAYQTADTVLRLSLIHI